MAPFLLLTPAWPTTPEAGPPSWSCSSFAHEACVEASFLLPGYLRSLRAVQKNHGGWERAHSMCQGTVFRPVKATVLRHGHL